MPRLARLPLFALTLIGASPAVAAPSEEPSKTTCRVEVGQPRPEGCAPWSGKPSGAERAARAAREATPPAPKPRAPEPDRIDPRKRRLEDQSRALLIQELARLERLFHSTPAESKERAQIVLRLADTFAELARLSEIESIEAEERARRARAAVRPEPPPKKPPPKKPAP